MYETLRSSTVSVFILHNVKSYN